MDQAELQALRTTANMLGAAIAVKRGGAEMAHYQDLVEQIPAVLYIDDVT